MRKLDKVNLLTFAYEESRYHRQFHHAVVTVYLGFLVVLLGYQIGHHEELVRNVRSDRWACIASVTVFVFLTLYVCWMIVRYHQTIATLNALIANIALPLSWDLPSKDMTKNHKKNLNKAIEVLFFEKYAGIISKNENPLWKGSGHIFFLCVVVLLAICNLIVFFTE